MAVFGQNSHPNINGSVQLLTFNLRQQASTESVQHSVSLVIILLRKPGVTNPWDNLRTSKTSGNRFNATNSAVIINITSMVPGKRHKENKSRTKITPLIVPRLQQCRKPVVCIIQTFDALKESPPGPIIRHSIGRLAGREMMPVHTTTRLVSIISHKAGGLRILYQPAGNAHTTHRPVAKVELETAYSNYKAYLASKTARHFTSDKGDNMVADYYARLLRLQCDQLPQQQGSGRVHLGTGHLDHQSVHHDLQQDCDQCSRLPQQQDSGGDHIQALHHLMTRVLQMDESRLLLHQNDQPRVPSDGTEHHQRKDRKQPVLIHPGPGHVHRQKHTGWDQQIDQIKVVEVQFVIVCENIDTAYLFSSPASTSLQTPDETVDRLVKLLSILSWNIKDGSSVVPIANGDEEDDEQDDDKLFLELAAERVNRAADCAICAMNIMTSHNMNKRVYLDDVIDRIAQFIRYQLQKTIYPSFDPVCKELSKNKDAYIGSMKKKRNYAPTVCDKKIIHLYNRCHEIVSLMGELVHMQLLTDTTVLHLSTMGVAPFFVENIPELQLSALKMVTGVFAKYDKHRKLVLDDILASIARLPQTKRSLRTYRLNKSENIQMLTALVLQLIQCVIALPDKMGRPKEDPKKKKEEEVNLEEEFDDEPIIDRDVHVNNKYESAMATAVQFLTVFLKKCGSKSEDIDNRPLFENFLQDLLTTVNTPEWPAAELLLSLLGKLLVSKFANKGTELSLRISSLDYLGVVAARLRKDAVQSKLKLDMIDTIIDTVREAESETGDIIEDPKWSKLDPEEQRTRFLQRVLLDFLTVSGGEDNPSTLSSRHFYISQR
jgi:hypothetical protein